MAEEPQVAGKDVKDYMGEQAVNPLMPRQGVYTPVGQ